MKRNIYSIVFFISIILAACSQSRNMASSYTDESSNSISYQQFYDDLSPYGQWVDNPEYGYVWSPRETGFQPYYSNGHWAYTNYGWTWVSAYNWGWATFHYGRWFYDDFYGWMWVPGYDWAPAWVSWRGNSDYYGWAPLCPQRRDGSYYQVQNDQWAFVSHQHIYRNDLNNYYINKQNNTKVINNTTIINNVRTFNNNTTNYQQGPNVGDVERTTHTKIRALVIQQSAIPGNPKLQNGVLQIYKPAVKQNTLNESKPFPSKFANPSGEGRSTNGSGKRVTPVNGTGALPSNSNFSNNPSLNNNNQTPVLRNNPINRIKVTQPGEDKISNPPVKFNSVEAPNLPVEQSKSIRQNQANPNVQLPGNAGSNTDNPKLRINPNNNNNQNRNIDINSVQPKTMVPPNNNNFRGKAADIRNNIPVNQQRSPASQGSSVTPPVQNVERQAPSFPNRLPQTIQREVPVNVNREAIGPVRK